MSVGAANSAKCVDDDVAMLKYTGMTCAAIKAAGACAQITGNAQLKAVGANGKCECSCQGSHLCYAYLLLPTFIELVDLHMR